MFVNRALSYLAPSGYHIVRGLLDRSVSVSERELPKNRASNVKIASRKFACVIRLFTNMIAKFKFLF